MTIELSVIVPVFNEVGTLQVLHQALHEVLDPKNIAWEVIFVDDGSADGSTELLSQMAVEDTKNMRVIILRRNFGQTAAIVAGIDHAQGEILVLIDADMQNDPADIPMLLDNINQGYDVVSGWRVNRMDKLLSRRMPSVIANWLIAKVTHVPLHDFGCTLKAYRREVITGFKLYGEMHRFIPVYARMVGAKIIEVPVQHHPRKYGQSKYSIKRTIKVLLDLFTVKFLLDYSAKPIYLFGGTGLGLISISLLVLGYLIFMRIFNNEHMIRSPCLQLAQYCLFWDFNPF